MEPGTPTNRPQWMPLFNGQSNDDALDFGNIFSIFRRRGLVVLGCAIIGGTLGGIVGLKKPNYQGDFQLLTKPLTAEGIRISNTTNSSNKLMLKRFPTLKLWWCVTQTAIPIGSHQSSKR